MDAYIKAMEDPENRLRMERTAPFTVEEESELYAALDEAMAEVDAAREAGDLPDSGSN